MPKPYPKEFRADVIRVARDRSPEQTIAQLAKDFGISETCLQNWLRGRRRGRKSSWYYR